MEPLNIEDIGNGWVVDGRLWRGAQPTGSAYAVLAARGCKQVISLRPPSEVPEEQRLVEAAGMAYTNWGWNGFEPPSLRQVDDAIQFENLASVGGAIGPIFVHCQHGSDRTGTFCACWRIGVDKWPWHEALEEQFFGLGLGGTHEFWFEEVIWRYGRQIRAKL